jgi:hypothetical protein
MNKTKAAAALVLRYLTARALFRKTDWDIPTNLERKIAGGIRALPGGVLLNEVALMPEPAIVYDRNDPEFWAAIIGGDDSAIEIDREELNEIREFVVSGECALPLPQQPHASWLSRFTDWVCGFSGAQPVGVHAKLEAKGRPVGRPKPATH